MKKLHDASMMPLRVPLAVLEGQVPVGFATLRQTPAPLALAQGGDPGDLSILDDPNTLEEVKRALARGPEFGG